MTDHGHVRRPPTAARAAATPDREPGGRTLVVVAHSDDEGLGLGARLLRDPPAAIVYLTDSAPRDPRWFTTPAPSREAYAAARRAEAYTAMGLCGVDAGALHFLGATDMEAFRDLARLDRELGRITDAVRPEVVWSTPYDGGHPDHDVAAFLAARAARRAGAAHHEFALYRWAGRFEQFSFAGGDAGELHVLAPDAVALKRRLVETYASQRPMIDALRTDVERYRRAPPYDFTARPCDGPTLYETWGWPVTAELVIGAFGTLEGDAR